MLTRSTGGRRYKSERAIRFVLKRHYLDRLHGPFRCRPTANGDNKKTDVPNWWAATSRASGREDGRLWASEAEPRTRPNAGFRAPGGRREPRQYMQKE